MKSVDVRAFAGHDANVDAYIFENATHFRHRFPAEQGGSGKTGGDGMSKMGE